MTPTHELIKQKLFETEAQIKTLAGNDSFSPKVDCLSREHLLELENLLLDRRHLLNGLLSWSSEVFEHFTKVNAYLQKLTSKLRERTVTMANKVSLLCDDPDFDDDYEIEATLKFCYNDEDSVLHLDDDEHFGSNFQLMIALIDRFYHKNKNSAIITITPEFTKFDEMMNWVETPINPNVLNVCYATHRICCHSLYSIPDFLRMNDFWAEVNFIEQSITTQTGSRFRDLKKLT